MKPNITQVQVHPKANFFHVQPTALKVDSADPKCFLPSFIWAVGFLVEGKDEVPAKGTPGHADYVPAVPAIPDTFTVHSQGDYTLTKDQWDSWDSSKVDLDYVRSLIAAHLGYSLV